MNGPQVNGGVMGIPPLCPLGSAGGTDRSVLVPTAAVRWGLGSARTDGRADMAGPHSPLGPLPQLLPGMADWSRVMRSRSRCCRAAYVRVSELPSCHCFLLVKASHKSSPYSSPLSFLWEEHQRHIVKGHVHRKGENL